VPGVARGVEPYFVRGGDNSAGRRWTVRRRFARRNSGSIDAGFVLKLIQKSVFWRADLDLTLTLFGLVLVFRRTWNY